MKKTKRLISALLVALMIILMLPVSAGAAARQVTTGEVKQLIEAYKNALNLGDTGSSIKWYWTKNIESASTLESGLDDFRKNGTTKSITDHLTGNRCIGEDKNKDGEGYEHSRHDYLNGEPRCKSNWYHDSQCQGFAYYIQYYLYGVNNLSNPGQFESFTLNDASQLKPGDHVRIKKHSFIYYGVNASNQLIVLQCNGLTTDYPCGLNFGIVWGYNSATKKDFVHTTSTIIGATVWRYKNMTEGAAPPKCKHGKKNVKFVNNDLVTCSLCNSNLAHPTVSGSGKYMDIIDTNNSGTAPSHVTPYGDADVVDRYNVGDTVYVVGSAENGFENLWYKLSDGTWIVDSYLGDHKHKKSNGFCSYCTDGLNIVELNNVTISPKSKKEFPAHFAPYGKSIKYYISGNVTVNGKLVNKHKKVWYRLTDGGWVYSDYLSTPVQTATVKISSGDVAMNNKPASSNAGKSTQLAALVNGTPIYVYKNENVGNWLSAKVGNVVGFVPGNYVTYSSSSKTIELPVEEPEPGIDVSELQNVLNNYVPSTPSSSSASILYPTDATYTAKFATSETNATVVANVRKSSGSKITAGGLQLYNAGGTLIKDHRENVTNVGATNTNFHMWYDINKELGVTLSAGTTYKYRFYAVIDGTTYYGDTYSFTTKTPVASSASILYPTDATYVAKIATSETNATVVANVRKSSGSKITAGGLQLYNADGTLIKDHRENVTNVGASNTNFHMWYDINKELGVTLSAGTTYKYRFYAVVNGVTYYGDTYSFTTVPGNQPVKEEPKQEVKEEPKEEVKEEVKEVVYRLTFDANGGACGFAYKTIKFNDLIGELPVPEREGYEFLGWYTRPEGGKLVGDNVRYDVSADYTVYAQWEKIEETYIIVFDVNGGKCNVSYKEISHNETIGQLPEAEREGYKFLGWYTQLDGGKLVGENTRYDVEYDITLYAHWEKVEDNKGKKRINMWIGKSKLDVNGKQRAIDEQGTVPMLKNGRTLVPIRAIVEAMNGTVGWNEKTQCVTIICGIHTIRMYLDDNLAIVDGKDKVLDVAPVEIGGRTMVPVRFVAENLKANVEWDEKTNQISIFY